MQAGQLMLGQQNAFALTAWRLRWPEIVPVKVLSEHITSQSATGKVQMLHEQLVLPCRRKKWEFTREGHCVQWEALTSPIIAL